MILVAFFWLCVAVLAGGPWWVVAWVAIAVAAISCTCSERNHR